MAPDLNSVPVSPRPSVTSNPSHTQAAASSSRQNSTPVSRRASQIYPMSPPPLPLASPGGTLPQASHTHAFPPLSPSLPSADAGNIPMRHPRPMTAAEMHLELEKEQEAVVNRLTRELSALRAHSASVASTTSSIASNALLDVTDPTGSAAHSGAPLQGATHPTSSRRHRSSSSVSRSGGLPIVHSMPQSHRQSVSSQHGGVEMRRSSSIVSTPRYEEVALQRAELEEVKRENEVLKQRIRELERAIRGGEEVRGRSGAPATESSAPAT